MTLDEIPLRAKFVKLRRDRQQERWYVQCFIDGVKHRIELPLKQKQALRAYDLFIKKRWRACHPPEWRHKKRLVDPAKVRLGRMFWLSSRGLWRATLMIGTPRKKQTLNLGRNFEKAEAQWLSLLERYGLQKKPKKGKWYWEAYQQRWREESKRLAKSQNQRERRRVLRRLSFELHALRFEAGQKRAEIADKMDQLAAQRTAEILLSDRVELHRTARMIRVVANRQHLGPLRYHAGSDCWFCWIGLRNQYRRCLVLGRNRAAEETAKKLWLVLKHALKAGSLLLLKSHRATGGSGPAPSESAQSACADRP